MGKVPNNLDECFEVLKSVGGPDDEEGLQKFRKMDEDEAVAVVHHGMGRWVRNNWGLWEKEGALYKQMVELGLHHADDMSGLILTSLHRHLNGKPLEIEAQVKYYKDYWAEMGARTKA